MRNPKDYDFKQLKEICQKIPYGVVQTKAGVVSRWFSIYLTWIIIRTPITPNQMTFFGSALYIVGAMLFVFDIYWLNFVAFFTLLVATLIDASDGEVARFRQYRGSYGGSYVEPLSHDIMYGFMFMPIAYGAYLHTGNPLMLMLGGIMTIFKLLFRMTQGRYFYGVQKLMGEKGHSDDTPKLIESGGKGKFLYMLYRNSATSSGLHFYLFLAIIFNRLDIFVLAYTGIFFLFWLGLFLRQIWRFRKISKQVIESSS